MKLANRAFIIALTMLAMVFTMSAQTLRSDKDDRNIAPTVGTGGPPGGPTGLFTVYDGQTLRRGEYTFSIAYSNFDRDPGDVDIVEVPVSFQIGLNDYLELFFNTDAYRAVKVNSPRNLSGFYLPNSNAGFSFPAIVMGTTANQSAVFRPGGRQPFVQFPFIGGRGFVTFPTLGTPSGGGNGASNYPLIGSPFGGILPGVVLQTAIFGTGQAPTSFTIAPSYLNDAPFINRTYGESSFSTFTVGAKIRFTGPNNPVGAGVIPFYRFYADKPDDFSGFNQLQRGASPGSKRGDFGAIFFADARVRKWANVSGNIGYIWNGDVESGNATLLDRGDEVLSAVAVDFPVNKYFQPILEFRSQQFVGGRTPNAFENNPLDGLAGFRVFPARWLGFGVAYRYHFNQQDRDSFDDEETFTNSVTVLCPVGTTTGCQPFTRTSSFRGVPPGFQTSLDPHGFIVQGWIGRRNKRQAEINNIPAVVNSVTVSETEVWLPCPPGTQSRSGKCSDEMNVNVTTNATDAENDTLVYNYTVSGGRIVGSGANVTWDLSGVRPGTYTVTAGVDDGCGICGETKTTTIEVKECDDCEGTCECPTVSITGPSSAVQPGDTMTFTANVSGGSQDSVTYNWSVDKGTIIEGQGTPVITVSTEGLEDTTVEARVVVGGLCERCQGEDSETGVVARGIGPIEFDDFGPLANDDVRLRLDNFFVDLQNNPNDTGYIINYGPPRQVALRERLIRNHISLRRFPASRIVIVNGGEEPEIRTKLWRVPVGADPPTP
ncbi:hypothetical protein BH20ACI4_BH20ACI4_09830 [soil metagenome]